MEGAISPCYLSLLAATASLILDGYDGPYNEGDPVVITCQVIAAATAPTFVWTDPAGNVASSSPTVFFFATRGDNGQDLTCTASFAGMSLAESQTIEVNRECLCAKS